jgi:hypothetical protein
MSTTDSSATVDSGRLERPSASSTASASGRRGIDALAK